MEPVNFIERPTQLRGAVVPGLPVLPPGIERHPVPGGGTRAIELLAGDRFRVLDREGMQPAEIVSSVQTEPLAPAISERPLPGRRSGCKRRLRKAAGRGAPC